MSTSLDILIPTLPERANYLRELQAEIDKQAAGYPVRVITAQGNRLVTTGDKRNVLLQGATAEYVWFVDDDDMIMPGAIAAIFKALESKPDCLAINGIMTTDGKKLERWEIAIENPYESKNGVHYRYPNHITPMKRAIAVQVKFPHITIQEDYRWATELKERGLLKTQEVVSIPVYHYRFKSRK